MYVDYDPDSRGDPTIEHWRFRDTEGAPHHGDGWLEVWVHEIVETERSGTLAVYYRQWFAPDGEPAWGKQPRRHISSLSSLRSLIRRRKMAPSDSDGSGEAGETAKTGSTEGDSAGPKDIAQKEPRQ